MDPKRSGNARPGTSAASLGLVAAGLLSGFKAVALIGASATPPGPRLWALFLLSAVLFLAGLRWGNDGTVPGPLPLKVEKRLFAAILVLAALFRLYRLDSIPPCLFEAQASEGLKALQVLYEHYRPLWEFEPASRSALFLYQLAFWFSFVPAAQPSLYLFVVVLSLATFPLVYWTFREIAGQRVALLSVLVLAVMRWNFNFARGGFTATEVPFYVFGTLAFLLFGLRTGKRWCFIAAGAFCGVGLYTSNAFLAFIPLLVLLGLYSTLPDPGKVLERGGMILLFGGLTLFLSLPFLYHELGAGAGGLSTALDRVQAAGGSLAGDLSRAFETLHWRGDTDPRDNLPGARLLDTVTGVFFFFGLTACLFRCREKAYFVGLAGTLAMLLPAVLSTGPLDAGSTLGATPFVALLAALPLSALWDRMSGLLRGRGKVPAYALFGALFLSMAAQNHSVYFKRQSLAVPSEGYGVHETLIGKKILQYLVRGHRDDYFFASVFYPLHPTVLFMTYYLQDHIHELSPPDDLIAHPIDPTRGLCYLLGPGSEGFLGRLKGLYPGGTLETLKDPAGREFASFYSVPVDAVVKEMGLDARFDRPVNGGPAMVLGNFPEGLPPGPYKAELTGNLYIESANLVRSSSNVPSELRLDGAKAVGTPVLKKGFHRVRWTLTVPAAVTPDLRMEADMPDGGKRTYGAGDYNRLPLFKDKGR